MKKTLCVCLLLSTALTGCVRKSDGTYTITLNSIVNQLNEWSEQINYQKDEENIKKGLALKEGVNIAELKPLFTQFEKLKQMATKDKKYQSCQATINKARKSGDELSLYYRLNRDVVEAYQNSETMGKMFTGMAVFACAADIVCRTNLSVQAGHHGGKAIKNAFQEIAAIGTKGVIDGTLNEKGISRGQANQVMNKYNQLQKKAQRDLGQAQPCLNYISNQEQKLSDVIERYAELCVGQNWFDMKSERGRSEACSIFISEKQYKKYY